jgi:hypothetical protein
MDRSSGLEGPLQRTSDSFGTRMCRHSPEPRDSCPRKCAPCASPAGAASPRPVPTPSPCTWQHAPQAPRPYQHHELGHSTGAPHLHAARGFPVLVGNQLVRGGGDLDAAVGARGLLCLAPCLAPCRARDARTARSNAPLTHHHRGMRMPTMPLTTGPVWMPTCGEGARRAAGRQAASALAKNCAEKNHAQVLGSSCGSCSEEQNSSPAS